MKVYSLPDHLEAPETNLAAYDPDVETARQRHHQALVAAWLRRRGYDQPMTGSILLEPMGDGYAIYMVAAARRHQWCLIHLPYGDAWHNPAVEFLSQREVARRARATEY